MSKGLAKKNQRLSGAWHGTCTKKGQQEGARGAPKARRQVKQFDADCLTNTPSQPLPLTLESDGPAAARSLFLSTLPGEIRKWNRLSSP